MPSHDGPRTLEWKWWVQPEAIESLEGGRTPADAPVMLELHVGGVVASSAGMTPVEGKQQIELALDHWSRVKRELGYSVPPSQERLLSPMNLGSPGWRAAVDDLTKARARKVAGDSYHVLQDVFDAFEAVVPQPYKIANWTPLLDRLPEQRREGVAAMLSASARWSTRSVDIATRRVLR